MAVITKEDLLQWVHSDLTRAFIERLRVEADGKQDSALCAIKVSDMPTAQRCAIEADQLNLIADMITPDVLPNWLDIDIRE